MTPSQPSAPTPAPSPPSVVPAAWTHTPSGAVRPRGLRLPLDGRPGPHDAITDVPGLEVGYATLIEGDDVRTGVTAIHPRGRDAPGDPCAAGVAVLNGNGEMTGAAWVDESGTCAGPITITNSHAVGVAHRATIEWTAERFPALAERWLLPVAAETWDGRVNDINGRHVTPEVVRAALDGARGGRLEAGSVGGGTGMVCYGFKGGSGSASRVVTTGDREHVVGVFVQANFGASPELVVAGVPVGRHLQDVAADRDPDGPPPGAGSVIVVVATDAPLLPGQCRALARRAALGLARTGTSGSHYSGDLFLACSTANPGAFGFDPVTSGTPELGRLDFLPWGAVDPFYEAVVQATEEATLDALIANRDLVGREGRLWPALPHDRLVALLAARGVPAGAAR
ncbi:P1 family peptidase [Patulibacter sp. SYSU D01012]|uniref:DmpA family aminopeptidase n=1 Tax=Patulibacter sp. SYSU D01012 TaxID=2817381 RepID=UPI001B304D9B|nr:P1 family peptidase [Patulibacter sp. SYSU D01012]